MKAREAVMHPFGKKFPGDDLVIRGSDKRAIVLLSGGIDSTVSLELALRNGWECVTLALDYGQRHSDELAAAREISAFYNTEHVEFATPLDSILRSPLTDGQDAPEAENDCERSPFYVPCRNMIFLSLAMGLAESRGIRSVFIGATLEDHIHFPDCRPVFLHAFEQMAGFATGSRFKIAAPLIQMRKLDVIRCGVEMEAPLHETMSCYAPNDGRHCGGCPACVIRKEAFAKIALEREGFVDPTTYEA